MKQGVNGSVALWSGAKLCIKQNNESLHDWNLNFKRMNSVEIGGKKKQCKHIQDIQKRSHCIKSMPRTEHYTITMCNERGHDEVMWSTLGRNWKHTKQTFSFSFWVVRNCKLWNAWRLKWLIIRKSKCSAIDALGGKNMKHIQVKICFLHLKGKILVGNMTFVAENWWKMSAMTTKQTQHFLPFFF